MKKINEIIKDFREDNDLSQQEVSKYLNIPRSTYGHYETVKFLLKLLYNYQNYIKLRQMIF